MSIKERLEEYLSNYENGFLNINAILWLYKNDPKLWVTIVTKTSFLDDPQPKQRCWHILNDIYEIQLCPIDNIPLKWPKGIYHSGDYLEYSSHSARCRDPKFTEQRMKKYRERTGQTHWYAKDNPDRGKQLAKQKERDYSAYISPFSKKEVQEKRKETWIKNYGVDNPSKSQVVLDRIAKSQTKTGYWYNYDTEKEAYNAKVWRITTKQYHKHFHDISDAYKRSNEWHLDHIFSISEGYKQDISPEIIAHYTNLQILSQHDNSSKGAKCGKTREQLFEDYEKTNEINSLLNHKPHRHRSVQ